MAGCDLACPRSSRPQVKKMRHAAPAAKPRPARYLPFIGIILLVVLAIIAGSVVLRLLPATFRAVGVG